LPEKREQKLKELGKRQNREAVKRYLSNVRRAAQEIGRPDYWQDVDYKAVKKGEQDFEFFCKHYLSHLFYLPWADCHYATINRLTDAVLHGKSKAIALPRGYGKTTLCRAATIWAALYGHHKFIYFMGADKDGALDNLSAMQAQLLNKDNLPLQVDFWELLWPVLCSEGEPRACRGQKYQGKPTGIEWSTEQIRMPHNPHHEWGGNGSIIKVSGILGSFLGANETDHLGRQIRPSLVVVDDPQTPLSARSASQTQRRIKVITSSVRGMKDVTKSLSIVIPCTVINPGDLSDQLTNRKTHPEFDGIKTAMVEEFPETKKWEQYGKLYKKQIAQQGKPATEYYLEHRKDMDAGAKVSWEHGYDPDEAESTLEYAMQFKFSNPDFFWAECQNDPLPDDDHVGDFDACEPDEVMSKINNRPRYEVPERCETLTAYVDVHDELLFYVVCAWQDDFTGFVVDYGTWPQQGNNYFTLQNARKTMSDIYDSSTKEGRIYSGLVDVFSDIIERDWIRADGEPMHIDVLAPDQRYKTDYVMRACKEHPHKDRLQPAFGQYIGARHKPIDQYERGGRNRGDRIGTGWILKRRMPDNPMRSLLIDSNRWKTFVHERIKLDVGEPGGITLFGDNEQRHRLFGEHVAAEYGVRTEGQGRELIEWKTGPGGNVQNHWFDCLTGCACLASFCGVGGGKSGKREQVKRVSLAEIANAG